MCSVVGYVGEKGSRAFVLEGLARLEYRGYDSAGFACLSNADGRLSWQKAEGGLENLVARLASTPIDGCVGIGHTRWATHGVSTELNAHPHFNTDRTISVVHNGIIENFSELKRRLQALGHIFYSDTDTEVIAHLCDEAFRRETDLVKTVVEVVRQLRGAFACALVAEKYPGVIIAIRKRSPLCVGVGEHEMFVASDVAAFADRTTRVLFLPDESFAVVHAQGAQVYDFEGQPLGVPAQTIDPLWLKACKEGFEHFMLKEIYEQKRVLYDTVAFYRQLTPALWEQTGLSVELLQSLEQIGFVACGTSAHASQIAAFFFEELAGLQAWTELASEFRHRRLHHTEHLLCCLLSQSGETADSIEVLRRLQAQKVQTFNVVNVPQSTMVRESDGFILTQARREIAVASTKSFTSQVALLYLLAHRVGVMRGLVTAEQESRAECDLIFVAELFETVMERYKVDIMTRLAPYYARFNQFIFLGRQISYPFAREAALKLKEIAYLFVDCYPAGELKHGSIALVEPSVPVVVFSALDDEVYRKVLSGAQEVKARLGKILVFAFEGQDELIALADEVFVVPRVAPLLGPLVMTGLMQLLVYHIARTLGHPIDKPRHLAKSVTVE